jgi:hypothetical protein
MTIDPREAATSLQDIAAVERRTREAVYYAGSSMIFIMWGLLIACGHGLMEFYPRSAGITWLAITAFGCAATALIVALRVRERPHASRDWRIMWALIALTVFGSVWGYLLGPVVPRHLMYAFQPSLFLLGVILAGLWVGRFFVILGVAGIVFIVLGFLQAEPWLRLWMAAVQSGTYILGGIWLGRIGVQR